jgi:hypothetical protein
MVSDPTISGLLEKQISTLERNLNQRLDATERTVTARFDRQDRDLQEIKQQTQRTNGRVTALEKARERAQGTMSAFSWIPPILASAVTAGLTILVMALSGGLH